MDSKNQPDLARALRQAWEASTRISAADWPNGLTDSEAAYAVQEAIAHDLGWLKPGQPQYWKSGGGSRQATLTHARLRPAGVRQGPADFSDLSMGPVGIEAEIALRIGREITPDEAAGLSLEAARELIDGLAVSVELVTSRWLEADAAPALLRQADFLSHGALALGDWLPFEARDWSAQACELRINDGAVLRAIGSHSLGDPSWVLPAWLKHATRHGQNLAAGSVVTTGAWLVQAGLRPGDRATVGFAGLGSVSVRL